MIDRGPPRRTIDKLDAIRHLLHASIRLQLAEEDPFIVNMSARACDRLISNVAKKTGKTAVYDLYRDIIKPEYSDAFWKLFNETYDCLRHADRDPSVVLGVTEIVRFNEHNTYLNIVRMRQLSGSTSAHAYIFLSYLSAFYPQFDKQTKLPPPPERERFETYSRSRMLGVMRDAAEANDTFRAERDADLIDVREAGAKTAFELP